MKRKLWAIPVLLMAALCAVFVSCADENLPAPTAGESTEPEETAPAHSEMYIPGLPVERLIGYFNEVAMDAEIVNSGDPGKLQKWDRPIYYFISGEATEKDRQVLETFTGWLNTIEGFPGMAETKIPEEANMRICFCDRQEFLTLMGSGFSGADGAVTFWYRDNAIYDALIGCRTDIDQQTRNSVLLEEIYNGLGPVQDTSLREDSIIYSGYSAPQELTKIDKLLLKLLYHPKMRCGMTMAECEAVIRELYY